MKLKRMTLWAGGLALIGALPCPNLTAQNPVPVRIESEWTGYQNSNAIRAECYIYGEEYSSLRLTGGQPGCPAMMFCSVSLAPTPVSTPFGDFFLSDECVVAHGWFDAEGIFEIPINLGMRELRGTTLHLQGLEMTDVAPGPELSWLLTLRFFDGNEQPELAYHSPAMQTFFCREIVESEAVRHNLLIRFEADESYVMHINGTSPEKPWAPDGVVKVYVTLKAPGGLSGHNKWHREAFQLTATAAEVMPPTVEVWVRLDHGVPGPFLLAVIDTVYGMMTP
jgi:hypothetical protein